MMAYMLWKVHLTITEAKTTELVVNKPYIGLRQKVLLCLVVSKTAYVYMYTCYPFEDG